MQDDVYMSSIDTLISSVNAVESVSELGLKNRPFPDDTIASLHNHLGNIKHYLSGVTSAMNASDQFLMVKEAEKELTEVSDDLYVLHHKDVLSDASFSKLTERVHETDELLRSASDPDFT